MGKGFVSQEMYAGRASSHNQITDLSEGFKLSNGQPFALFIWPKSDGSNPDAVRALVNCKLYQDDNPSPCPFTTNCWDIPAVFEISANGIDLANFDVYWGAGVDVEES